MESFQFNEKGEISSTPEMLMKYLSHSMPAAVAAEECTNPDQSFTPTLLIPEYFPTDPIIAVPESLTSGFQLNGE